MRSTPKQETAQTNAAPKMDIADILVPHRVVVDLELASKKAVLETLAGLLAGADPRLKSGEIFDSLIARERLGTTGLGAGIAIPHGRISIDGIASGAFVRTSKPIGFDAVDNAPVDLFFALCVPKDAHQGHLDLLAALAARFADNVFLTRLRAAAAEQAYELLVSDGGGNG